MIGMDIESKRVKVNRIRKAARTTWDAAHEERLSDGGHRLTNGLVWLGGVSRPAPENHQNSSQYASFCRSRGIIGATTHTCNLFKAGPRRGASKSSGNSKHTPIRHFKEIEL